MDMTDNQLSLGFITIKHGRASLKCKPENAQKVHDLLSVIDKSKGKRGPNFKKPRPTARAYPTFIPGMTTAEYIDQFNKLCAASKLDLMRVEYTHADRPAPMLDPSFPEVLMESEDLSTGVQAEGGDCIKQVKTLTQPAPKTCEEVALFIFSKIAANAIEEDKKHQAQNVATGRLSKDEAAANIAVQQAAWSNANTHFAYTRALERAQAIIDKDPIPLIKAWGKSITGSRGSVAAFGELTGVKLARLNSAERTTAIYKWAGWTADQVAAHEAEKAANEAAAQATRAAKDAAQRDERTEAEAASSRIRTKSNNEVTTVKAFIDSRIAQGFTRFEMRKTGSAKRPYLSNPSTSFYFALKSGVLADRKSVV
jgi:hypothetical protein